MNFCVEVGLPITLKQIGVVEPTEEKIMKVAEMTCAPGMLIHNMPFEVTPQMLFDAIFAADAIGRNYLKERGIEV
jgi:glycerol dehydrogenase